MLLTRPWDRLLWTGQFGVQFLTSATFCSLLQNVTKDCGVTQPPIQCIPGFFPWGLSAEGVMLTTTHLQLVLRLRMTGAIPLLPLCAFMA